MTDKLIKELKAIAISIHTTRVGGDVLSIKHTQIIKLFQSTPPVWVVTKVLHYCKFCGDISIHTTRVGGDLKKYKSGKASLISIHTTRVGGDALLSVTRD